MQTTIQRQQARGPVVRFDWKKFFKRAWPVFVTSEWVTWLWDWLQSLLATSADPVLWFTMVYSCYRLIPGAPAGPEWFSNLIFICQFVALDVGGLGLNRLAVNAGFKVWSYPRIVAFTLIGVTLVSVGISGLQHVISFPGQATMIVEVVLVVLRSCLTVIYGQAIHSLKDKSVNLQTTLESQEDTIARLQRELQNKRSWATLWKREATHLRATVYEQRDMIDQLQSTIDNLQATLQATTEERDGLRSELEALQSKLARKEARAKTSEGQPGAKTIKLMAIQKEDVALPVAIAEESEPRERIRKVLLVKLQAGEHIDYKAIAEEAQAGYSTVKKWVPVFKRELEQSYRQDTESLVAL